MSIGERPKLDDVKDYKNINHIKLIMQQCWQPDERDRPTMKGVAFILGIDRHTVDPDKIMSIKPLPLTTDNDFRLERILDLAVH